MWARRALLARPVAAVEQAGLVLSTLQSVALMSADEAVGGICALCGQEMVRYGDDAWHPYTVKRACPPEPERDDYDGWAAFAASGLRSGRPGVEHFRASNGT